jgi:hypothetical protein
MTSSLMKGLPLAVFLLTAASGCELINFDAAVDLPPSYPDPGDGAPPSGPAPLYPFRPGSIWQYDVTGLDGSMSRKYVTIDKQAIMVGGGGDHQLEMAYPVKTSAAVGGLAWLITMQQKVGDQIVNYRESTFDQYGQMLVDTNWEPQQLEIDQSNERTRTGVSWLESYTEVVKPAGFPAKVVTQNETWTVVGQELLTLPNIKQPFQTIVYQKTIAAGTGGTNDAGRPAADAGTTGDGGVRPPMLTSPSESAADGGGGDGGVSLPKTMWWARGYGKVKESGGGQPTEELGGLELH